MKEIFTLIQCAMLGYNNQKMLLCVVFVCLIFKAEASDFDKIYNRMYASFLLNPSSGNVKEILESMSHDGSFSSLNYKSSESIREHPEWIDMLASAYKNPKSSYYQNRSVKDKYLLGLKFWIETDHHSNNWWSRYIAYPKEIRQGVIIMKDEIIKDAVLYKKTISYLRWAYEKDTQRHMTGANGVDIIMGAMAASVISENKEEMLDFRDKMNALITMQNNGTGIENDFMFGQHSGHGRQLYIGNYGKEYLKAVISYFEYCNETVYNSNHVALIEDHIVEALQWIFYNKNYDPNQAGRMIGTNNINSFISIAERMVSLNTSRKPDIAVVLSRIKGANTLVGNRHFWRFDYMIHRRSHYFTSTRMTSIRTVGNEAGHGSGVHNYHAGSGVNYIMHKGTEYSGRFFSDFNPRQFPGITAEQDTVSLPIPNWGKDGGSLSSFAGGASDGYYGVSTMFLQRRGISAKKSWFYFDDEFVCLGTDINQKGGTSTVYSVMNQCNKSETPKYSLNDKVENVSYSSVLTDPDWILHGDIAYFNMDSTSKVVVTASGGLFSINVDHGINPENETYAYIVKPGVSSSAEADGYKKRMPIKVEANGSDVQVVRHEILKITEAVFYEPSSIELSNGIILEADKACAIVLNEDAKAITVSNPYCESNNPSSIQIKVTMDNKTYEVLVPMPDGNKSGSSVIMSLK